jgi:hypothetical protein
VVPRIQAQRRIQRDRERPPYSVRSTLGVKERVRGNGLLVGKGLLASNASLAKGPVARNGGEGEKGAVEETLGVGNGVDGRGDADGEPQS